MMYHGNIHAFIGKTFLAGATHIHAFSISNTFISNTRLKLAKCQANAKQHPGAELLLFENYLHSSSRLSSKNNGSYSKKISKRTSASVFMRLYN